MSLHRKLRIGLTSSLAGLMFVLSGCATTRPVAHPTVAASPPAISGPSAARQGLTANQTTEPDPATPIAAPKARSAPLTRDAIKPTAPLRYTIKRGDTLWGIASMFLRDPWQWPEIWYNNPQIHNPHLIFPGDVLVLAYGTHGRPRIYLEHGGAARAEAQGTAGPETAQGSANAESAEVKLEPHLRSKRLAGAIPTIRYADIAAFLSRPAVLTKSQVDHAPHVVAFRDLRQIAGSGDYAYIRGLRAPVGARFVVLHIGEKLRDPQTGRVLGYQALYTATAQVVDTRQPEEVLLSRSARETLRGDCLYSDSGGTPLLDFVLRAPPTRIDGRIISVVDDINAIGQYDIVAINQGTSHGVIPGTILAVDSAGAVVTDRGPASYKAWSRPAFFAAHVKLPSERAGTLLVFKSYRYMSYALVVGASGPMQVDDIVRNP